MIGLGKRVAPPRFVAFVVVCALATAAFYTVLTPARAFMAGFDVAAAAFLLSLIPLMRPHDRAAMKRDADANDANRVLLLVIAAVVSGVILASVAIELAEPQPDKALVVMTLVLAWMFSQSLYALHYAHIFYVEGSTGGLDFGGDIDDPDYGDFIYFAWTIGMAFATSDTRVETHQLRRIITWQAFGAFVFNIGVLAFSISVLSG